MPALCDIHTRHPKSKHKRGREVETEVKRSRERSRAVRQSNERSKERQRTHGQKETDRDTRSGCVASAEEQAAARYVLHIPRDCCESPDVARQQ